MTKQERIKRFSETIEAVPKKRKITFLVSQKEWQNIMKVWKKDIRRQSRTESRNGAESPSDHD